MSTVARSAHKRRCHLSVSTEWGRFPSDAGFGYLAHVDADISMWGEYGPRPEPNHDLDALFGSMSATAEVEVSCSPEAAWDLISSIERIGEFSPECVDAWWTPDRPARAVGGRFEGRNRVVHGEHVAEWVRPCDVTAWDPGQQLAWSVGDRYDGTPSSRWSITIAPRPGGVLLRQEFQHEPDGLSGLRHRAEAHPAEAEQTVAERTVGLGQGMAATLARMKVVLETDPR